MPSQNSFGSKLDNAKKIWAHLSTFTGYTATGDQSVAGYGAFISSLEDFNKGTATKAGAYATATKLRRKTFKIGDDSLEDLADQIHAAVCSIYDADSEQAAFILSMVKKIKGNQSKKPKPPKQEKDDTKDPDAEIPKSISRREAGFGNQLKIFADIVATVKNYGASYTPDNPKLTVPELESRLAEISQINSNVMITFSNLRQAQIERLNRFDALADLVKSVKYNVRSQKRRKSVEYGLIKGIRVSRMTKRKKK